MCGRVERLLKVAHKATLSTPDTCKFAVGAVIAMGSRVVSTGFNKQKTHPASPDRSEDGSHRMNIHAEVDAICSLSREQKAKLNRCTIYVTRRRVQGNGMGMSKPCPNCMKYLMQHGVKDVWYTNREGEPRYIRLS